MTSVVIIMMLLFIFLIQIQFFISRDLAYYTNKKQLDQIEQTFIHYYQKKHTWSHITKQKKPTTLPFVLMDPHGKVLWKSADEQTSTIVDASFPLILKSNKNEIGHLYVMTPRQYQVYIIKNTWNKYMYGVVGLASLLGIVFAFLLILLISGTLTRPIRTITQKIRSFESGDMDVDFEIGRKDEFNEIGHALASMKQKLERTEEARKTLVSNVAHELKTPLMVIHGEIELLHIQQKTITDAKYESISEEIQRLTKIIHDILHLSKVEAQQEILSRKWFPLADLLAKLENKTAHLFHQSRAILLYPETDQQIYADEDKLLQILYNLVQNALIHGQTTSTVTISIKTTATETILSVADDGQGMNDKDRIFLFERFYRGDKSRSRKTGGSGIGLSIVKAYVEMHGGSIDIQSKEGQGTIFHLKMPNSS
ncbi:Signal transduction histidine kinase [Seinonella peptonophila]|uniref:histidine kinase n=2 Tax=Seinonella peptonophila TaxID=112248 RepID=A0A1M4U112_9BACL|nr:Signal transduction histidine kinase [Seinonella peptonophila]